MDDETPGMGHNMPPINLDDALDPEKLEMALRAKYAHHTTKVQEMLGAAARFCLRLHASDHKGPDAPDQGARKGDYWHIYDKDDVLGFLVAYDGEQWFPIVTDLAVIEILMPHVRLTTNEQAAQATSFVAQIKAIAKKIEADRKAEKTKFDAAAKAVQTVFQGSMISHLADITAAIERGPITAYAAQKAAEERRRREEEAKRLQEEAERAQKEALRAQDIQSLDNAITTEVAAEKAGKRAAAPIADLARTHGSLGGVAAAQEVWTFEVVDKAAIPPEYLLVDTQALGALARSLKERATVPGVRFYSQTKVVVR